MQASVKRRKKIADMQVYDREYSLQSEYSREYPRTSAKYTGSVRSAIRGRLAALRVISRRIWLGRNLGCCSCFLS